MEIIKTQEIVTFHYDFWREYVDHRAVMESNGYMLIRWNYNDYEADYSITTENY